MEHTEYVDLGRFETYIHYHFKDKHLLLEALSHSSYANEKHKTRNSNERLEFLGDSVLSIVVSEFLFHKYPDLPEGELTKLRASMVCEKALHVFAREIHLGEFLLLGKGEEHTGGRSRSSILADAFEAVIAAIFLDGGMDAAKRHIMRFIPKNPVAERQQPAGFHDYKTRLQEVVQKNPEEKVEYLLVSECGPDHDKAFEVIVCLNSNVIGKGVGHSKKAAEQLAAKEALSVCRLGELTEGVHAFLDVDYNYVGKVQYICAQNDITIVNTEYADGVTFELMMENAARNVLEKNMTEMSSGKICLRDTCSMQMYRDDTGKLCR